jgi:single-stranded DNA-specific DHH superfamily exonuclease
MKHIKKINEFNNLEEMSIEESSEILKKMGTHATIAIVKYLQENPELIRNVMDLLFQSKDKKVQKSLKSY